MVEYVVAIDVTRVRFPAGANLFASAEARLEARAASLLVITHNESESSFAIAGAPVA